MITTVLDFGLAYLLTWQALIVFCFLALLTEHNEARGFSVFFAIVAGIISYLFFKISIIELAEYAAGYLVIGVVWSIWRYKRYVSTAVEKIKACVSNAEYKKRSAEQLHPAKQLDKLTAWILNWPFSAIDSAIGDVITGVQTLVKTVLRGVYHKIYSSATAGLTEVE